LIINYFTNELVRCWSN